MEVCSGQVAFPGILSSVTAQGCRLPATARPALPRGYCIMPRNEWETLYSSEVDTWSMVHMVRGLYGRWYLGSYPRSEGPDFTLTFRPWSSSAAAQATTPATREGTPGTLWRIHLSLWYTLGSCEYSGTPLSAFPSSFGLFTRTLLSGLF